MYSTHKRARTTSVGTVIPSPSRGWSPFLLQVLISRGLTMPARPRLLSTESSVRFLLGSDPKPPVIACGTREAWQACRRLSAQIPVAEWLDGTQSESIIVLLSTVIDIN